MGSRRFGSLTLGHYSKTVHLSTNCQVHVERPDEISPLHRLTPIGSRIGPPDLDSSSVSATLVRRPLRCGPTPPAQHTDPHASKPPGDSTPFYGSCCSPHTVVSSEPQRLAQACGLDWTFDTHHASEFHLRMRLVLANRKEHLGVIPTARCTLDPSRVTLPRHQPARLFASSEVMLNDRPHPRRGTPLRIEGHARSAPPAILEVPGRAVLPLRGDPLSQPNP